MKLTEAQKNELVVWEYFIPKNCRWLPKTDKDIEMFFEWSERGKHKQIAGIPTYLPEGRIYFHALVWGKKRAGMNIHELWEQGVLVGCGLGYFTLLGGEDDEDIPPRAVVDFMKKEMFKGIDAEVIENCYQSINQNGSD